MSGGSDRDPIPGVRRAIDVPASKRGVRRHVQDELRFHLEGRIEELVAGGMNRAEAEVEARKRFGDVQAIGSELESIDLATHRRRSFGELLVGLWRDARYAVRGLVRQPGFAVAVVLTLALSIGANTAIFSAVDAVLLRPLPTPWLHRLVVIRHDLASLNLRDADLSAPETMDLIARSDVFETGTGYRPADYNLAGAGEPRRVTGTMTIGDFFGTFGMRPHIGRLYGPADSEPGRGFIVVLSHGLWQEMFGGDPSAIGRTLELNDRAYEIIGVAPPGVQHPRGTQLWMPLVLTTQVLEQRGTLNMLAVMRLRDGITEPALGHALDSEYAVWTNRTQAPFGTQAANRIFHVPFIEYTAGELRPILIVLMAAVMFVLLIACANVASLQLVRSSGRAREVAVRVALGAGRWPIVRQRLVESLVLAFAGGAAGLALAAVAIRLMRGFEVGRLQALQQVRLDFPVLLFTLGAVVAAGVLFGLAPALRAARVDPQEALKESPRGASVGAGRQRFLQGAVVVQLALALVLLLGAGVAIQGLGQLLATDPGFRPEQAMTMQISARADRYATPALRDAFRRALYERLRDAPGIEAAGVAYGLPFTDQSNSSPFEIIGAEPLPGGERRHANMWFVGGDYFRAMGIPVLAGRVPDERDAASTDRVLVIDEQLAREYFPGQDPVGRRINQGPDGTIIGVVASVKHGDLAAPPKAAIYHWFPQNTWVGGWMSVVVRGPGSPAMLANTARGVIREIDPQLPIYDVQSMAARIEQSVGARRFTMRLLGAFALLALVLAALGIYGVISYATGQRAQEFGIRLALGADPGAIVRMVLRGGALLAVLGLAGGAVVFIGVERMLGSLLHGLGPRDPAAVVASALILATIALAACWIPARRAARVDPTVTLRAQ